MKQLVFFLLFWIGIIMPCDGQIHVVYVNSDTVTIAWEHDWKDIQGNDEMVTHFEIYLSHNDGEFIHIGSTDYDNTNFRPPMEYSFVLPENPGKYIVGVLAVDIAGNKSIMATSDVDGTNGGWYLIKDKYPPTKVGSIRIK